MRLRAGATAGALCLWALAGCEATSTRPRDVQVDAAVVAHLDAATRADGGPPPRADATPGESDVLSSIDAAPAFDDDALFDTSRLLEVSIEMDPVEWNALRREGRDGLDLRGLDCLDAPFDSPYTWRTARVVVDGQPLGEVGVRKKGFFGSLSDTKPSLLLDLDRVVEGQSLGDLNRLTLNNSDQDPSLARTCLAYDVFRRAGVPAPRCSHARVRLNGLDLGVYVHVESVRKPFLRRHFDDDEGTLYEGTLSDFTPAWRGTFEQKTNEDMPSAAVLDALTAAAQVEDARLIEALEAVLDVDAFLSFWAAEVAVAHWDGYAGNTNNFFVYADPASGRARFLPWGVDGTFQTPYLLFEGEVAPASVLATGIIARRLYLHAEGRARFVARLREVVGAVFDAEALIGRLDADAALVGGVLPDAAREVHARAVDRVRAFIQSQPARILSELDAGGAAWRWPLRGSPCLEQVGALSGVFETTWGTLARNAPFETGTSSAQGTLRGAGLRSLAGGAAAGYSDDLSQSALVLPWSLPNDEIVFAYMAMPNARFASGPVTLGPSIDCSLNRYDAATGEVTGLAACLDGVVTLYEAGVAPGARIAGDFEVGLWARSSR